jgi:Fe-S-cluster-containing hydrogenase component 2
LRDNIREKRRAEFPCEWVCGVCAAVCPSQAIDYVCGAVSVAREECTGCGDCARVCPGGILKEEELARL